METEFKLSFGFTWDTIKKAKRTHTLQGSVKVRYNVTYVLRILTTLFVRPTKEEFTAIDSAPTRFWLLDVRVFSCLYVFHMAHKRTRGCYLKININTGHNKLLVQKTYKDLGGAVWIILNLYSECDKTNQQFTRCCVTGYCQ